MSSSHVDGGNSAPPRTAASDGARAHRPTHGMRSSTGPQYAASGTIRLRVIGTTIATKTFPDIVVDRHGLNHDGWYVPLTGTIQQVAGSVGLQCQRPDVEYRDPVPGGPDTVLAMDPAALHRILRVYDLGARALHEFAPHVRPILWPEHFDLAIRLDEVNYGVSPGDTYSDDPYAYVGPNSHDPDTEPFWNAPFGAVLPVDPDDAEQLARTAAFFRQGQDLTSRA
jgi:hypothetical protein